MANSVLRIGMILAGAIKYEKNPVAAQKHPINTDQGIWDELSDTYK